MIHTLKILPEYFDAVRRGDKNFELRKDDRNFQVGDIVILNLWMPGVGHIDASHPVKIKYILRDCEEFGLMKGYCIFGW